MRWIPWLGLLLSGGCASVSLPLPAAWESVPAAAQVSDLCAHFPCAAKPQSSVHIAGNRLFNGNAALTPELAAIDSFDVSPDRKEVVFSARRKDNFDVGLVSLDGSAIHWIPEDPADEVNAQWAPRGNKVSYILHTATGSLVRTVHIPTATSLSVDFPETQIDALAWEPQAERFAVVIESPDASQRLLSMTYEGTKRQELVGAGQHLDVSMEPVAGALMMRPAAMHYNERLPLIVWIDRNPLAWSDARASLILQRRVALAVMPAVSDTFWKEVANVAWIDTRRTYVVGGPAAPGSPAVTITGDPALPPHRYVRRGNSVFAPPAVVQSFAAALIADDLKGTAPPNGRR